jgi:hypothetical protein
MNSKDFIFLSTLLIVLIGLIGGYLFKLDVIILFFRVMGIAFLVLDSVLIVRAYKGYGATGDIFNGNFGLVKTSKARISDKITIWISIIVLFIFGIGMIYGKIPSYDIVRY